MFITFEGGEGSGKTTHIDFLSNYLTGKGKQVLITKEPGGTPLGIELRQMLLQKEPEPLSEIFLFAADRIEHVEKVIKPALDQGKIVICDRYIDSTLAYQLGGRGLPEDLVRYVNWISCRAIVPDLTFLLDVTPIEGLKRAKGRSQADRFESEIMAFHERVHDKYREIASNEPNRIKIINAMLSIEEVEKGIKKIIDEKL